jgi:hypothetical protein
MLRSAGLGIEQWFRQQRWLWRYGHCQSLHQAWVQHHQDTAPVARSEAPPGCEAPRCLLDLRKIAADGEQGRRFHTLVSLLGRSGYDLWMVPRLQFLQTAHRPFKARVLSELKPFWEDELPRDFAPFELCLSDRWRQHRRARRTIPVLTNTLLPLAPGDLALPYGFYPGVWDQRQDALFESLRQAARPWRLFFGGHCSRASYARIRKYTRLSPLDRYQVIETTRSHFGRSTREIDSDRELESARQRPHAGFVLIDNATYRPTPEQWLPLLATAAFFLAAPGCDYPLSHNAIEAIAVGTIPVLEYDSLFSPPLADGVNCLTYRGRAGLRDTLRRVEQMSAGDIAALRQGVIDYYESHLSPAAFRDKLEQASTRRLHLFSYLTPAIERAA